VAALPDNLVIRPPRAEDVPAVAALEAEVFTDPWPAHIYHQEVGQPLRFQRLVFNAGGFLVAYLFGCWQVDELHVLKVATHPLYQGRGLATLLMHAAHDEAREASGRGLILEVRPSNRRALLLYRHIGYRTIGRRPHYYTDGEDALVMAFDLQPTGAPEALV
jgi:ribosomal-protein-alanine acetyltransferase